MFFIIYMIKLCMELSFSLLIFLEEGLYEEILDFINLHYRY